MRCEFGPGRDTCSLCEAFQVVDLRSKGTARDDYLSSVAGD